MSELEIMVTGRHHRDGRAALLWGLTTGIGAIVVGAGKVAQRPRRKGAGGRGQKTRAGIPAHHLVAIAAAVAEVIGAPHRIVRVSAPAHRQSDWTARGRGGHRTPGWPGHRRAGRNG